MKTSLKSKITLRFKVVKHSGFKYLFKTQQQILNRYKHVQRRDRYGSGKLSNGRGKKSKLVLLHGNKCEWCLKRLPEKELTVDHITEIKNGGSNKLSNLRLLCRPCHDLRHDYNVPVNNSLHN